MARRMEGTADSDAARGLPAPEREQRRSHLNSRLTGLKIEGRHDPALRLIDTLADMVETGCVRWPDWQTYTAREQELVGTAVDKV